MRRFSLCVLVALAFSGCAHERQQVSILPAPQAFGTYPSYQQWQPAQPGSSWSPAPQPTPAAPQPTLAPPRPEVVPTPVPEPEPRTLPDVSVPDAAPLVPVVPPQGSEQGWNSSPSLTPVPPLYVPYGPDNPAPAELGPGPELQGPQMQYPAAPAAAPAEAPRGEPRKGLFKAPVDRTC